MNGSLYFDFYFSNQPMALGMVQAAMVEPVPPPRIARSKFLDIHFPDCLICNSGLEIRHATLSIEINGAGFSTAGQSVQFRSRAKFAIT